MRRYFVRQFWQVCTLANGIRTVEMVYCIDKVNAKRLDGRLTACNCKEMIQLPGHSWVFEGVRLSNSRVQVERNLMFVWLASALSEISSFTNSRLAIFLVLMRKELHFKTSSWPSSICSPAGACTGIQDKHVLIFPALFWDAELRSALQER